MKFDVGHGGGSFGWDVAIPALKQGFPPDTISTDLHIAVLSMRKGRFGNVDSFGYRVDGSSKLTAELTVRAGKVVWDLDGKAAEEYTPDKSRFTGSGQ